MPDPWLKCLVRRTVWTCLDLGVVWKIRENYHTLMIFDGLSWFSPVKTAMIRRYSPFSDTQPLSPSNQSAWHSQWAPGKAITLDQSWPWSFPCGMGIIFTDMCFSQICLNMFNMYIYNYIYIQKKQIYGTYTYTHTQKMGWSGIKQKNMLSSYMFTLSILLISTP